MRTRWNWSSKITRWWWIIVPLLICLIIMLPRLLSPQFGLEDDGTTIMVAQQWTSGKLDLTPGPDLEAARFRPFYWGGLTLIYLLGGKSPIWYYLSNTLVLMLIAGSLAWLVRARGATKLQAGLTGILFAIAGPIIESFYTISKSEPLQVAWVVLSLLPVFGAFPKSVNGKIVAFLTSTLALICASFSKETTLAMIPASLAWLFLEWLFNRKDRQGLLATALYAGASLFAGVFFLVLSGLVLGGELIVHGYAGHYNLDKGLILFMLNYWIGWFLRDFIGLFLCILLAIPLFRRSFKSADWELLFTSAVWMGVWVMVFLPLDRLIEYYLLPFSVGYAIFCGVVLGKALEERKQKSLPRRVILYSTLTCLALFLITTLTNNYSNGRIQLIMDRQDDRLYNYLLGITPAQDQLLVTASENAGILVDLNLNVKVLGNRPDIQVGPFKFQTPKPGHETEISYNLITAEIQNRPLYSVRLPDAAADQTGQALLPFLGKDAQTVFISREQYHLFNFNLVKLLCPLVKDKPLGWVYCQDNIGVVDTREYSHVWRIYPVVKDLHDLALPAVFQGGAWEFQMPDGMIKTLKFGQPGDKPLVGDWTGTGRDGIGVVDPVTLTWSLDENLDGQADQVFQLPGMTGTDIPLAGDWTCRGKDDPGFFRPSDGSWHFWTGDYTGAENLPVLTGTEAGVVPLVGDWNGDGCTTVGIYRPARGEVNLENLLTADLSGADFYAPKNATPVAGDWGGAGIDTLAFFEAGDWTRLFSNCDCTPANPPPIVHFGRAGVLPLAGKWPAGK
jgi:hypothetical protein